MDSKQSKQLVIAAWQAFATRDAEQIAAMFADDAEWLAPNGNATARALGIADHMIGKAAIARFIAVEFGKLFSADVEVDFRGFHAEGPIVVVEERMSATLADGRRYENDYCFVFECANGRIARVREYMDTMRADRMIFGDAAAVAVS